MALTDSLISFWELEEASGTRVDAVVASGNDLTDNNTVTSAVGIVGTAADFESGNSEYLSHASNTSLQTGDIDFTVMTWVKFEADPNSGYPVIIHKGWTGAADGIQEYVLYYDSDVTGLRFTVEDPGQNQVLVTATNAGSLSAGVWYLFFGWHDATNNQLGIAVFGAASSTANTAAHSAGVNAGTRAFVIGASVVQSLYYDGLIDQAGFWKRVLTSGERTELYNGGAGLSYAEMQPVVATTKRRLLPLLGIGR